MSTPQVYLITGCSSGLGLFLAHAALKSGARVIATARNPARNPDVVEELEKAGATSLALDVTSPDLDAQVQKAIKVYGQIDVLINNAGAGTIAGPVEETDLNTARAAFETNFWGTVRVTQAVLPIMRRQKSGCIVNISSASVYDLIPGISFYAASKAALETMTASLAPEVAGFGIKVVLVTPADMRTPFFSQDKAERSMPALGDAYKDGPVSWTYGFLKAIDGNQTIDPVKAADTIVTSVENSASHAEHSVIRLPIGMNAGNSMINYGTKLIEQVAQTKSVWESVDFPADK